MQYIYCITIPASILKNATDMLRYDSAFELTVHPATDAPELTPTTILKNATEVDIKCLNFTSGRWHSFGVNIEQYQHITLKVTQKYFNELCERAVGFTKGIRFFQKWLQIYPEDHLLVEDH